MSRARQATEPVLTRIELTNFMSHVATVIEPAPGLTVLVGPNNCGKSAVVAALQLLCKNSEAKFAVRHGAKDCTVQVQTDDGHTILWRRTKASASYRLNGQSFDRLGRGVPDALHELLRLPMVGDESGDDFDIHFGAQKSPIFLLNSSAGTAARFFASSSDAIRLVEMQRRHKDKLAERQRQKTRLEAESKLLTEELERLAPAVELDRRLKAASEEYGNLLRAREFLEQFDRDASGLAGQSRLVAARQAEHDVLRPLDSPPAVADLQPLARLRRDLADARHAADRDTAHWQAMSSLPAPPALAEVNACERLIGHMVAADRSRRAEDVRSRTLQRLESPPVLADARSLQSTVASLTHASFHVEREERRLAAAAKLAPPIAVADDEPLRDLIARLAAADRLVVAARAHLIDSDQQLAVAREELIRYASSAECPTCGSPLDAERLLARSAVGLGGHDHD